MSNEIPYWVLISILWSSLPMSEPLAMALHRRAYELYRSDDERGDVESGLAKGYVENLRHEAVLGSIAGPAFEAQLESERGHGVVRFVLTRQGIELMAESEPSSGHN